MSETGDSAFTAFRVADRLRGRTEAPWEVVGERIHRYETHLSGTRTELTRAPVHVEGYSVRLFRRADDQLGVGFAASSDLSDAGIGRATESAEANARFARFPARKVELPGTAGHTAPVDIIDPEIAERPMEGIARVVHALLAAFEGRPHVQPSFGSVRVTQVEETIANSEGLHRRFAHTIMELEFAVKAFGGPESRPPGEHWVNERARALPQDGAIAKDVARWCTLAEDVRKAAPVTTGATRVILPASVLADILPPIIGYRLSGTAQLRKMCPPTGTRLGAEGVTLTDDGLLAHAVGTSPCDDEGTTQSRRPLIEGGVVKGALYDLLYGSALGEPSSGNGRRDSALFPQWMRFSQRTTPSSSTLVWSPGKGGSDTELIEACQDGLWVEQLGYAFPDALSGAFGGEIRSAYRIRNGKLAEPVRGGTLGGVVFADGNEPSLFNAVSSVGSSPSLCGFLKAPSVLFDGLTISGA
jgi:predicted Zn-dependent protease